ncbi:MAG: hypothetical protein WA709_33425 [Stellaceae bacterium]
MQELYPRLTVARFGAFAHTFFSPGLQAVYIEGLRKARLPEE